MKLRAELHDRQNELFWHVKQLSIILHKSHANLEVLKAEKLAHDVQLVELWELHPRLKPQVDVWVKYI